MKALREIAIWRQDQDWPYPPCLRSLGLDFPRNKRLPLPQSELQERLIRLHDRSPLDPGKYVARFLDGHHDPAGAAVRFTVHPNEAGGRIAFQVIAALRSSRPRTELPSALETERRKVLAAIEAAPPADGRVQLRWTVSSELWEELQAAGYQTMGSSLGTIICWTTTK